MTPTKTTCHSFLLRLWASENAGTRASVADVDTGETRVFADVDGLCRWLSEIDLDDPNREEPMLQPATPADR